ncbi:MAG: DNA repair protein RadC [Alistipes sp.]|nr:DNA repair protein RadC [Alistipes sp.]
MSAVHEKLAMRGIEALDERELLTLLLEDEALASTLLEECGTLQGIASTPSSRLRMVAGLGSRLSTRIHSAVEIGRRLAAANKAVEQSITSSDDVVEIMRPILREKRHEECWAIFLTNSNRVIERTLISRGGIQATVVDQRLIVKRALELLSTRLILVHNHPSGSAVPSRADFDLTAKVKEATRLFDIQLLDHIVITDTESYSFKSNGKL